MNEPTFIVGSLFRIQEAYLTMTYQEWLAYLSQHHNQQIELGLVRIRKVAERLGVSLFNCPVVIVTGTNGKGTCVFALEAIYKQAGYKTALFHSPFLYHPREQIRYDQQNITEAQLCLAFAAIDHACADIHLTEFEWWTLAALWFFQQHHPDIVLLEVGMGGREDAVNVVDADAAIITNVELEHQAWLGDTRDQIAYQKAGIMRPNKVLILGNTDIPILVRDLAKKQHVTVYQYGQDFLQPAIKTRYADNSIACALKAIDLFKTILPVTQHAIDNALHNLTIPGRFEYTAHPIPQLWDVGHNPDAISMLRKHIRQTYPKQRYYAVFCAFADKAVQQMVEIMSDTVEHWWIAPIQHPRTMSLPLLQTHTQSIKQQATYCSSIIDAYQQALITATTENALLLIFGSFALLQEVRSFNVLRE